MIKSRDGRVEVTFNAMPQPWLKDDYVQKILKRLKAVPASAVQRFTLVAAADARKEILEALKQATAHLPG